MSLGRIGTRAAVVGLGMLASLALMAAPSWAAKGGNSANAKLCEPGGYPGVLFNQHGESFKNEGQCTKAGAHGQLAGLDLVTGPVAPNPENLGILTFKADFSGFGFKPGAEVLACAHYAENEPPEPRPGGTFCLDEASTLKSFLIVAADRTFSVGEAITCEIEGAPLTHLFVQTRTASNVLIKKEFPPPSGC